MPCLAAYLHHCSLTTPFSLSQSLFLQDCLPLLEPLRNRLRELMAYTPLQQGSSLPVAASSSSALFSPQQQQQQGAGAGAAPAGGAAQGSLALAASLPVSPHEVMTRLYVAAAFVATAPQLGSREQVRKRASNWLQFLQHDMAGQTQVSPASESQNMYRCCARLKSMT